MPGECGNRVSYFAWEAADVSGDGRWTWGDELARVHAVTVIDPTGCRPDPLIRLGDRNVQTLCGRKVGQRADHVYWRPGRERIRAHLQLHLAERVAGLPRCGTCSAVIRSRRLRPYIGYREFIEWTEPLPAFPGRANVVDGPCAALWPTYYRWRIDEPGRWLPDHHWEGAIAADSAALRDALIEAGMTPEQLPELLHVVRTFRGVDGPPAAELRHELDNAREWHPPYVEPAERAARRQEADEQARIQDEREAGMRAAVAAARRGDDAAMEPQVRALQLVSDVLGDDVVDALNRDGYVDLPSGLVAGRGYRVRPWTRVGLLRRSPDGSWVEQARSLCVHPPTLYPQGDEFLTLYLRLRFAEAELLRVANFQGRGAA